MIWTRKLGVFELLLGEMLFELFLGDRIRALTVGILALVAWYTKRKFGGEFSLQDAWSVVTVAGKKAASSVDDHIN